LDDAEDFLPLSVNACTSAVELYAAFCRETYHKESPNDCPRHEFAADALRESGPSGLWSELYEERISRRAVLYMSAARDHLYGLKIILETRPFGLSIGPSARSAMEASGKCMWLISHELGLGGGTRPRVARLILDEEADFRSEIKLRMAAGQQNEVRDLTRQRRVLTRQLREPGLFRADEIVIDPVSRRLESVCGQKPSQLSNMAYRSLDVNGEPGPSATLIYGYLSNMTHSTYSTVLEMTNLDESATWLTPWSEDPLFCARATSAALASFLHGWESVCKWAGFDSEGKDQLFDIHDRLVRDLT
jgi:hypothetical protein